MKNKTLLQKTILQGGSFKIPLSHTFYDLIKKSTALDQLNNLRIFSGCFLKDFKTNTLLEIQSIGLAKTNKQLTVLDKAVMVKHNRTEANLISAGFFC